MEVVVVLIGCSATLYLSEIQTSPRTDSMDGVRFVRVVVGVVVGIIVGIVVGGSSCSYLLFGYAFSFENSDI